MFYAIRFRHFLYRLELFGKFGILCPQERTVMHETSLIQNMFDVIREDYLTDPSARITAVTLEVGSFSNIEPLLLNEAFQVMKRGTEFDATLLRIQSVITLVECHHCDHRYEPSEFPFLCPSCGQFGGKVIRGDDLIVKHIEMEVTEYA